MADQILHPAGQMLCRSCARIQGIAKRCAFCGSDHFIQHSEISDLSIAHIDCDAFFASIEKRDAPELQGKPVIIGGGKRGVVATCCYTARLFGVRSAMPMFKALRACPQAVVIPPNFDKYKTASRAIRARMDDLTPLVQQVSIDEAYLDLSGTEKLHGRRPAELLGELQNSIKSDIGITVSIGLSYNKFLAKSASDLDKPNGFALIGKAEARTFLAERPVEFVHGVGPALSKQIYRKGYQTLGHIQQVDLKRMIVDFGETGQWLHQRANGIDPRPVDPSSERKSVSSETTFFEDLSDKALLEDHLWWLCEKTSFRAKELGVQGNVLTLKLKTSDFKSRTRRITLHQPTQLAQVMFQQGRALLTKECDGARFRLIGIGISDLEPEQPDMGDLIDPNALKRARAERAADLAKIKFGNNAISTGRGIRILTEREKRKSSNAPQTPPQNGPDKKDQ
ncbi:DNA polymerase IV [Ponticaulis sp.]|uniref:DNA polymerase IV n=1 Tax=Ponticaulis sp. TaxID=2020902 RepID=UPI000B67E510|nr:DNA polymerase IV [Ponticaulis sp.]OUY00796.1 MAG: DNA polymerase IV [Hyphomonadaceae bacterium TMED5]